MTRCCTLTMSSIKQVLSMPTTAGAEGSRETSGLVSVSSLPPSRLLARSTVFQSFLTPDRKPGLLLFARRLRCCSKEYRLMSPFRTRRGTW